MAFNIFETIKPVNENVEMIDVDLITYSHDNFFSMDMARVKDLKEEIIRAGFKSVIEVRKTEAGMYEVICGETRARANMLAFQETNRSEFKYIPAVISEMNNEDAERRLIMDNLLSREITPAEKLKAVERLKFYYKNAKASGITVPGKIQNLIANDLGLKKSQVGNYEKVLSHAIPEVKDKIESGEISISAAAEISDLEDKEQLMFLDKGEGMVLKTIKEYKQSLQQGSCSEEFDIDQEEREDILIEHDVNALHEKPINKTNRSTEAILDDIGEYVKELDQKLNCVEFRNEYAFLQKIKEELIQLDMMLGL